MAKYDGLKADGAQVATLRIWQPVLVVLHVLPQRLVVLRLHAYDSLFIGQASAFHLLTTGRRKVGLHSLRVRATLEASNSGRSDSL